MLEKKNFATAKCWQKKNAEKNCKEQSDTKKNLKTTATSRVESQKSKVQSIITQIRGATSVYHCLVEVAVGINSVAFQFTLVSCGLLPKFSTKSRSKSRLAQSTNHKVHSKKMCKVQSAKKMCKCWTTNMEVRGKVPKNVKK